MKKLLVLMLAAIMVFAMVACSKDEASDDDTQGDVKTSDTNKTTTSNKTNNTDNTAKTDADEEKEASVSNTLFASLYADEKKDKGDAQYFAELVNESSLIPFALFTEKVETGKLDGFKSEISGFESAVCIKPQVASPFILYLFTFAEDTEESVKTEFIANLKTAADLNWMEFSSAEEVVCQSLNANTVFFCMARHSFAK